MPPIHFHATEIRAGKDFWRRVQPAKRAEVGAGIGEIIANDTSPGVALFGAVIEKTGELHSDTAVKRATAECCRRFDVFLKRVSATQATPTTGMATGEHELMLFADGRFDQRARVWVNDFRKIGTDAGVIERLSDIPFFVPAKESRLLQLADYVAHALFLLFEHRNPSLARPILQRIDTTDGVLHGLKHVHRTPSAPCPCPSCHSRAEPGSLGLWLDALTRERSHAAEPRPAASTEN